MRIKTPLSLASWRSADALLAALLLGAGCAAPPDEALLTSTAGPLHLEEHLERATIVGSEPPVELPAAVVWEVERLASEWRAVGYPSSATNLPRVERVGDALRITTVEPRTPTWWPKPHGGIYVELPGWRAADWAYVRIRARTADPVDHFELGFNRQAPDARPEDPLPFVGFSAELPMQRDGKAHDYLVPIEQLDDVATRESWRELGFYFGAATPVSVDVLSVAVIPREAEFGAAGAGVKAVDLGGSLRRAVFTHAPASLSYRLRVPAGGRLHTALGVLRREPPVRFAVTVAAGERQTTLLDEAVADPAVWHPRRLDLSPWAGDEVTVTLASSCEAASAVGLWGAPTVAGPGPPGRPNVILYVIDGAGADFMSVYGYNRRTTPWLERLAREGVVFERAFSNSSWSKPSTTGFMTSLHDSVLGGFRGEGVPLPDGVTTMAERLHAAGYQTAVFSSNPFAATLSGLERGVDVLTETGVEPNNSESSRLLHEAFWHWRETAPGEPYWVHFQTTDIHEPYDPVPPFAGLYLPPELRAAYRRWDPSLFRGGGWRRPAEYERQGIDQPTYSYAQQALYDEAMAHNDYQLGRLVERLRERGEWRRTLLIVGADHGYPAAGHRLMEPLPPSWGPLFNSHESRIPLIVVWPERIRGGRRIREPVSMVDLLPTILELAELPPAELAQGASLAPLLLESGDWRPPPVFLDEFVVDPESGELRGQIEVVDGRWGASLEINPDPEPDDDPVGQVGAIFPGRLRRPVPLLLYDLERDPYTLHSLHAEHPDLVERYTRLLETRFREHRRLAERFGLPEETSLRPAQLRALRALGYLE